MKYDTFTQILMEVGKKVPNAECSTTVEETIALKEGPYIFLNEELCG